MSFSSDKSFISDKYPIFYEKIYIFNSYIIISVYIFV